MSDDKLYETLLAASISYLSYRVRSASDIESYLSKKLHKMHVLHADVVERVMTRLKELRYIDDQKFAETFIESRLRSRPKSTRTLMYELQKKGISEDLAKQIIDKNDAGGDDRTFARKAIERKLLNWRHLSHIELTKKMYGFLSRRGFSGDIIRRLIDEVSGKDYNG